MALKVDPITAIQPAEATQPAERGDGSFKFTLTSHIEETELQEKLNGLMEDITAHRFVRLEAGRGTAPTNFPGKIS